MLLYFATIFWKGEGVDDATSIETLVQKSIAVINNDRKSRGISIFSDEEILSEYFSEIKAKLKELRSNVLGLDNELLVAALF